MFVPPAGLVVTHRPPKEPAKGENAKLSFVFVESVGSAVQKAKKAAGTKDVTVIGGASTAQQCISSQLVAELHIGIVPVLFGDGLPLFDNLRDDELQLETIKVMNSPNRTDIKFLVVE